MTPSPKNVVEVFDDRLASAGVRGFWSMLAEYEMFEPNNPERGRIWTYDDYHALALEALHEIAIEKADRRNLFFSNPGLPGSGRITQRLLGGVQAVKPGEVQAVHRHTAAATRVLLEGTGGFTTVEGGKCRLEYGDVVINPNGLWHESGNDGDQPVMWMDVLDLPLTRMLHANFFANDFTEIVGGVPVPRTNQRVVGGADRSAIAYGTAGGVRPAYAQPSHGHGSAQLLYKYAAGRALLDRLRDEAGSAYDGITVEYYDPATGGPVLRTLDVHLQLLRSGERTLPLRQTAGTVYCCLEGGGRTVIDGESFTWRERDIFVVPGWSWRHHEVDAADAVLCAVSDAPALGQLGLLVREHQDASGDVVRERGVTPCGW
jgi:gentisate 1,2-dioxygenase